MSDPSKLSDEDLTIAMGTHDDGCECPNCKEWAERHMRRVANRRIGNVAP